MFGSDGGTYCLRPKNLQFANGNPVSYARIEGIGYKQFIISICETSLLLFC
jgi:hypothetical protein